MPSSIVIGTFQPIRMPSRMSLHSRKVAMFILPVMPGFMPGIHVFLLFKQGVDGRDKRALTPVFDGLCPAMTKNETVASSPCRV